MRDKTFVIFKHDLVISFRILVMSCKILKIVEKILIFLLVSYKSFVILEKVLIILIMTDAILSHFVKLGNYRQDLDNIMSDMIVSDTLCYYQKNIVNNLQVFDKTM